MTRPKPKDLSASVRQRLTNHAVNSHEDFQVVLAQYGFERLLYRLSQSAYSRHFTIKGALMFLVWAGEPYRPTRDLDLTARKQHTANELKALFQSLCALRVEDDGLLFVVKSVNAEPIREETEYGGMRVSLVAELGRARIPLQVDIGFGDAITPKASIEAFPVILDFPAPRLAMYPKETAIAEKYETIVRRDMINSRMKDYYDLWALARSFDFEGGVLKNAIRATFQRRKTSLPEGVPMGLSDEFSGDRTKLNQWNGFVRRTRLRFPSDDLKAVVDGLRRFLVPPSVAACRAGTFDKTWPKGGPWR
jgi:predicted nucleotidyltransferase component of viral defense system